MKKLLITTAALLALAAPAQADELPATYLGQWCQVSNDATTYDYVSLEAKEECERADRLTIKRNGLTAIESGCE
jgi:hypothetical protein